MTAKQGRQAAAARLAHKPRSAGPLTQRSLAGEGHGRHPAIRYGRSLRIEPYGAEPIPAEERHGSVYRQFTLWFAANMVLSVLVTGFFAASFGLSLWAGISAVLVGTFLGSLIVGASAGIGTKLGVPQQVQGRGPTGFYGNLLPVFLLTTLSSIGWAAVDTVFAVLALRTLVPIPFWAGAVAIFAIQTALAVWGHNAVHAINVGMTVVLGLLFIGVTVVALHGGHVALSGNAHAALYVSPTAGWITFAGFAFAYVLTWAPLASDFSRYLPETISHTRVAAYTFLGSFVALAWLEILGVLVSASAGSLGAIPALAHLMGPWAPLAMGLVVLSTFPVSAIVLYGSALSLPALGIPLHRTTAVVVSAGAALAVTLVMQTNPYGSFYDFLDILAYLLMPFSLIILLDYFLRMRPAGKQRTVDALYDRRRRIEWGFVAWVIGCGCSALFWHSPLYTGLLAGRLARFGDLSYLAGAVAGVGAYLLLYRLPPLSRRFACRSPACAGPGT
ncbi:MAG TPA: cytosine permease [Rhodanobacteraceae bacterium]